MHVNTRLHCLTINWEEQNKELVTWDDQWYKGLNQTMVWLTVCIPLETFSHMEMASGLGVNTMLGGRDLYHAPLAVKVTLGSISSGAPYLVTFMTSTCSNLDPYWPLDGMVHRIKWKPYCSYLWYWDYQQSCSSLSPYMADAHF
jgi:hypothetical protein